MIILPVSGGHFVKLASNLAYLIIEPGVVTFVFNKLTQKSHFSEIKSFFNYEFEI